MRRQFHVVRRPEQQGSQRSYALAGALAEKCEPETLERLLEIFCLLDAVGGQVYVAAYRTKYGPDGQPLEDVRQPGRYLTDGYVFHYDHIAKINRQPVEPDDKLEDTPERLPTPPLSEEEQAELLAAAEDLDSLDSEGGESG